MNGAFEPKSDPAVDEARTKIISFLFQSAENSGAGCEYIYVHFHTCVSLHVYWKVWTGWRCTGGLYKAGSVSVLKSRAMG